MILVLTILPCLVASCTSTGGTAEPESEGDIYLIKTNSRGE